jgi:hypothetical protein
MRGSNLRAIQQRVERIATEMRSRVDPLRLVEILREGRQRARSEAYVPITDEEARETGRRLRARLRAAGIL